MGHRERSSADNPNRPYTQPAGRLTGATGRQSGRDAGVADVSDGRIVHAHGSVDRRGVRAGDLPGLGRPRYTK